jgi:xanthine dehydrogenase accessory factor
MIVTARGYHGTIGGGTLEWRAIANAQALLGKGSTFKVTSHALGPELGQCCGGRVTLATEAFNAASLPELHELAAREAQGPFITTRHGFGLSFGESRRAVFLFGAGHVGRALVLSLASLPVDVTWIDPRPDSFPRAAPANATVQPFPDPLAALQEIPAVSLVFVMTHSHALDLAIVDAALRNPSAAHVGLIGSATKRARFVKRLREAGLAESRIGDLICPIGIPGIRSKLPAAIAAAAAAQILVLDEELKLASFADKSQVESRQQGRTG